jgi:hypothetical protein
MKIISLASLLLAGGCLCSALSCDKLEKPVLYIPAAGDTVRYTASDSDFANPERGFYRATEVNVSNYTSLELNQLQTWRTLQQADGGGIYKLYSTLVFRSIVLDGFTNSALSTDVLDKIKTDFATARQAGVKLIVRFSYTTSSHGGSCPEGGICPPYGDAPKNIVLQHITQLKPLLQDNADVIACVQEGFIGIWGENYYTDYFGDPSSNGQSQLLDSNWQDRIDVLKAVLDAVPANRMVQVREPQMKQRYVYGIDAPVTSGPLTEAEAFSGEDKARIGMHNDCFLSGVGDYGTYDDYGNSTSPRQSAVGVLEAYAQADNKYTAAGGETCDDTYSPQNDCETAGMAQTVMRGLHYSFLNCAYNNDVNNDWVAGGCMENIKRDLGYRFVLTTGVFPGAPVTAGMQFRITLRLRNEGYASPYNQRPARLILRSQKSGKEYTINLATDVRKWYTGDLVVNEIVTTDAAMTAGNYDLLLSLPDAAASLAGRPEYAIRLANTGVWEESTGYNKLGATLTVR